MSLLLSLLLLWRLSQKTPALQIFLRQNVGGQSIHGDDKVGEVGCLKGVALKDIARTGGQIARRHGNTVPDTGHPSFGRTTGHGGFRWRRRRRLWLGCHRGSRRQDRA
jgi:hypothetical protein